jgi:D-aminoacyl-tRNA deacylase
MELLVAYKNDPAGHNMAAHISEEMEKDGELFHGKFFDLVEIETPAISADWLEEKFHCDGFVFLSKHAAESGALALTCHSTGNFSEAKFGGKERQVAIPHPQIQKNYIQKLWDKKDEFSDFQITIEATHHGPTALNKPTLFVEIGTTPKQWNDEDLCYSIASIVSNAIKAGKKDFPVAICFGGTHYPEKFTRELIHGKYALGTVMPKHALDYLDEQLFNHILERNFMAKTALLDWDGMGLNKQKVVDLLKKTNLEVIRL